MPETQNKNKFIRLLNYSGNYKYLTIVGMFLSALSAICLLVPFVYIWDVVNALLAVAPDFTKAQNLDVYAINAFTFAVLGIILNFFGLMGTHLSAFKNEKNMKDAAIKHLLKLPLGYFSNHTSGGLRKIIDYSTAKTEIFLAHQLFDLTGAIMTPIVFLILLFSFDWRLGLICLIPIILCFVFMYPMFSKESRNSMEKYEKYLEEMNGEAVEYVRGIPVTKAFQQSIYSFKNFINAIKNYGKFSAEYSMSTHIPMTAFTVSINGFFALLIPAGILLAGSVVDVKFFANFMFYIIFTPICAVMMMKIMTVSQDWMLASCALDSIEAILNENPLVDPINPQKPKNHSIEFEGVYFDYENADGDEHILNDVNLKINENETVALVGPSGGGKTTIASLIPRFWDVNQGSIKVGDVDVRSISTKELMKNISFVFQNTTLFKDSIYNNVAIGRKGASRDDVKKALSLTQCDDIIDELPDGINTVIGSEGTYLSGGQQQRIALARAVLKDAPIIILDEATALADPENEYLIQKAISEITKDKTVIMIAHRLSSVKNVDKIYVVENGRIVEEGNHHTLIDSGGIYSRMWDEFNQSIQWKVKSEAI
ncbi:ABC transporter ATP-binding protein [Methanobrevibacter smithii]|uniref:ABC transporter ATP-binding protein n=2 Tax=Methanobrevibacter TaxID=2172 RepID=A0A2H4U8X0_METSM|nr:ABC transporter ATP-binding protein [Methanobrevibacter smithii]ATZ60563.1 ABC transporter ATP-binding protein [Methanobrevibacter smithii]MBS6827662.1 ABC transporter ATP-binding protein [Methanobrevibacter smithii]MDO5854299.1 ABC transporter ATP-binding protein [Methanobrevibacter smithii]BDF81016.1 ABC transporter ATP-binding protein [Methanobrevibacter smithii]BDF82393.1 ABC transporter ATP-binding protein [Methanobrevibacter smithii]